MTFRYGVTCRNNMISQIQTSVGASGQLRIYSGAEPANCAATEPSGTLATIVLPASFLTSSGGVTTLAGTWSVAATGAGTAVCWRIYDGSAVCHVQGNMTDLVLNNNVIAIGQTVSVTSFAATAGNA